MPRGHATGRTPGGMSASFGLLYEFECVRSRHPHRAAEKRHTLVRYEDCRAHCVGKRGIYGRHPLRVQVDRRGYVLVTEAFLDQGQVRTRGERERGARVSQVVPPKAAKPHRKYRLHCWPENALVKKVVA